jgi:hypothetical protein
MSGTAGPDIRDYRVNCDKIAQYLPSFRLHWTVAKGAAELFKAFEDEGLGEGEFLGSLLRIEHIKSELARGALDLDLRRIDAVAS